MKEVHLQTINPIKTWGIQIEESKEYTAQRKFNTTNKKYTIITCRKKKNFSFSKLIIKYFSIQSASGTHFFISNRQRVKPSKWGWRKAFFTNLNKWSQFYYSPWNAINSITVRREIFPEFVCKNNHILQWKIALFIKIETCTTGGRHL